MLYIVEHTYIIRTYGIYIKWTSPQDIHKSILYKPN